MYEEEMRAALDDLPLSALRVYEQIGSTNLEAFRWAEHGAEDLSLVVADEQTAGRGRMQRAWYTPPGAALAFSLVLRRPAARNVERLTALGALAVCQALRQDYHLAAEIKWPNDVLLERCKAAGVLVEAIWQGERLEAAVLGVGVNVAPAAVPGKERLAYPATSVESVYGKQVSRPALLRAILEQFLAWRLKLDSPEFLQAWERWLAFRGEWVIALERERPVHEGQLLGLEEDGALRLRDRSGRIFTLHGSEIRLRLLKNRADDR